MNIFDLNNQYSINKAKEIKNFRDTHDIRCENCKTKMRAMKNNDYKTKKLCKTCWKLDYDNDYKFGYRTDLYECVEGKWKTNKKIKEKLKSLDIVIWD
tara:strand:- start:86 stop:379 length:294 start_codon:yes stop_codon:yes gene_type:complete